MTEWFAVLPAGSCSDGKTWTISKDPNKPGWETECACGCEPGAIDGYGLDREIAESICERLNLRALAVELDTALARAGDRFGFVAQELKKARLSVGTDAAEATLRLACTELQRADDLVRKLGKTLAEFQAGSCGDVEGDPRGGQTE